MTNRVRDALLGVAVGDAIGVPVEFLRRKHLNEHPVSDMVGFGTHNQPSGTWSDDSSLTFCLADSLCDGYDTEDIGQKFVKWKYSNLWTPHGEVFDIGISTSSSIQRILEKTPAILSGGMEESDNGNGSLMRIMPLALFLVNENDIDKRFEIIKDVSSITHGHFRSFFSCFIYIEIAINLLKGETKDGAYVNTKIAINKFIQNKEFSPKEIDLFDRILKSDISSVPIDNIYSDGYVIHTLEASIWCFINSSTYKDGVLKAVNLGEDTDTTGAVVGGLLGLFHGVNGMPDEWVEGISRYDDVVELCDRLNEAL